MWSKNFILVYASLKFAKMAHAFDMFDWLGDARWQEYLKRIEMPSESSLANAKR
jgi:hypothetical protein